MALASGAVTSAERLSGSRHWLDVRAAGVAAVACVVLATATELLVGDATRPFGDALSAPLVSLGLLCVVGLTVRRAPGVAWFCSTAAASLGALDLVAAERSATSPAGPAAVVLAIVVRAVPAVIAFGYVVTRSPQTGSRLARATAGTSVAIALGVLIVALIEGWNDPRPFDAAWSRLANRVLLVEVAGLLALAVGLGVGPAWTRARERWARSPDLNATARMRILVDELAPFDAARRQAAVEAERTQLAAALHATVLPPLRTALAASQAGSREAAERGLGEAVDEVEQLMASREPVIVDALGLLAGLEWLAERIQVRSGIPVEIDVATTSDRPPNSVERAAFRVAQLALDNAGRHSAASTIRIAGSVARDVVGLTVNDDGVGFVAGSMPRGRGLRDMDAAAEGVRARVSVGPLGPLGASERRGTAVGFDWPAR